MNVSLTPELEKVIDVRVTSGMYQSASEVVREALRLLREQDLIREVRLKKLRHEIARGLEAAGAGRVGPFNSADIKRAGRRRLTRARKR